MVRNQVIVVNKLDNQIGTSEKLTAHREGLLHRAFSVLIFNSKGQLLIHKRADEKYHSGGLWTNACCSHPQPGEDIREAAELRLSEEMGITVNLQFISKFIYKATLDNNLIEHELDYVFTGTTDQLPNPDPTEVQEWKYVGIEELNKDILQNPGSYTFWFKEIFNNFIRDLSIANYASR